MEESWDFLDVEDLNLLYRYAKVLDGSVSQIHSTCNNLKSDMGDIREEDKAKIRLAQEGKRRAYYLIWFVYYHVLGCKTFDAAKPYMNLATLKKYRLESYIRNSIYLGMDADTMPLDCGMIIPLEKVRIYEISDIKIVLEILYNRYDFIQQFECFIRNTGKIRRKNARDIMNNYLELGDFFNE